MNRITKVVIVWVAAAGLLLTLGYIGFHWLNAPRQSAVRSTKLNAAHQLELGLRLYREKHGVYPANVQELVLGNWVTKQIADEFVVVGKRDLVAYQKSPCRAVKKGEPWGGVGERAHQDHPAIRFLLLDGQRPIWLEESEFQSKYASLLSNVAPR